MSSVCPFVDGGRCGLGDYQLGRQIALHDDVGVFQRKLGCDDSSHTMRMAGRSLW